MKSTLSCVSRARSSLELREVSPIIYWFSWGLTVFNLFMSWAVHYRLLLPANITEDILNPDIWGIALILLGLSHGFGLLTNIWSWIKWNLAIGVFVKTVWFIYMMLLGIEQGFGRLFSLLTLLGMILWIQVLCNLYFPREIRWKKLIISWSKYAPN